MEFLNKRTASIILAGSLGFTAISLEIASAPESTNIVKQGSDINYKYYPDGSRIVYKGGLDAPKQGQYSSPTEVYEFCIGHDMVEDTIGYRADFTKGPVLSVNDPACANVDLSNVNFTKTK